MGELSEFFFMSTKLLLILDDENVLKQLRCLRPICGSSAVCFCHVIIVIIWHFHSIGRKTCYCFNLVQIHRHGVLIYRDVLSNVEKERGQNTFTRINRCSVFCHVYKLSLLCSQTYRRSCTFWAPKPSLKLQLGPRCAQECFLY